MTCLVSLVVYILGFVAMFYYSARRDVECDLEQNPREAFLFALFWPLLIVFLAVFILVEKIANLVCVAYRYCYSKVLGKD